MGDAPAPREREQREVDDLRKRRDRGETLTLEEAARVGALDVVDKDEPAMPSRAKVPREADTSE